MSTTIYSKCWNPGLSTRHKQKSGTLTNGICEFLTDKGTLVNVILTQHFCDEQNCNIFILKITGKSEQISKSFLQSMIIDNGPMIIILFYCIRGGSRAAATSKMECFVKIVNGFQPLTIITKHSILNVAAALDPPLILI